MKEAEDLPDDVKIDREFDKEGKAKKNGYEKIIGKANAQRNRLMDRLLIDKQKSTIHQVSLLLNRFRHEIDFQPLGKLIAAVETDLAKTAEEFFNLETEVEKLGDSFALKAKVLKLIRAKTKIQARSEEEKKSERRGRPLIDLEKAEQLTNKKKKEA